MTILYLIAVQVCNFLHKEFWLNLIRNWRHDGFLQQKNSERNQFLTCFWRKLVKETIVSKLKYLTLIWAPRGSKGAQNGINVPISSKLATKIFKFGQIWHVIYETWWCYLFLIYSNILPILGHPRGQKWG